MYLYNDEAKVSVREFRQNLSKHLKGEKISLVCGNNEVQAVVLPFKGPRFAQRGDMQAEYSRLHKELVKLFKRLAKSGR